MEIFKNSIPLSVINSHFSGPLLQKWTIDLSFEINRICKHLSNFKNPIPPRPTPPPRGCHKCMVPYETPTEIAALNISRKIEFKHSTHWYFRDILVAIQIIIFLDKVIKNIFIKNSYIYNLSKTSLFTTTLSHLS